MTAFSFKAASAAAFLFASLMGAAPALAADDASDRVAAVQLCRETIVQRTGVAADAVEAGETQTRASAIGVRFAVPDEKGKKHKTTCVMRRSTKEIVTLDLPAALPRVTQTAQAGAQ